MGYLFYSRRAKVLTVVCWLVIIPNIVNETARLFLSETTGDLLLLRLITTFRVPQFCVYIIKAIFVILYFLAMVSWAFPQAMNCIFCSVQVVDLYLKSISEVQMLALLFFYIVLLALWRAYVSSSNELPGDEFAVRSVQRVVQRVGQVYR